MRISTGMIYSSGVDSMQKRTSSLLTLQQQASSGKRILKPSDDPVASARALEVTQAKDINAGQARTRDYAKNSLGIADGQLKAAGDLLVRVKELAIQGGNAVLSAADRKSLATELRARFDELMGLANSTDGAGNYLFGGYQSGVKPFSGSVDNGAAYVGDSGLRSLLVSASRNLPVSGSGNDIFMGVKNGNGVFVTGTQDEKPVIAPPLTLSPGTIADASAWNNVANSGDLELRFWTDPAGDSYYDLVDRPSGNSLYTGTQSNIANQGFAQLLGTPVATPGDEFSRGFATGSAALADPTVITAGVNDQFVIAVDGGSAKTVVLTPGSYSVPGMETQVQADIDAALGANLVTVSFNGANLEIMSNLTGSNSAVTLASPNTYNHPYSSGEQILLSASAAIGPPPVPGFDFGAAVIAAGVPASGDTFSIKRPAPGVIATGAVSVHQPPAIDKGTVSDAVKWTNSANSGNIELRFWTDSANAKGGGANAVYYDLVNADDGKSLFTGANSVPGDAGYSNHAFVAGAPIAISGAGFDFGASVTVTGTPASGDAFTLKNGTDATGNGYFVTAPKMAASYNAGSGIIGAGEVLDEAKWNNPANSRNVEVRFWEDKSKLPPVMNYDLVDLETGKSLFTDAASVAGGPNNSFTHRFAAGDAIRFSGLHVADPADATLFHDDFGIAVTISGTPKSGDAFTVKASSNQSIFDTVGDLALALEAGTPAGTAGNTHLSNRLSAVLTNLALAADSVASARATIGAGLSEVDSLDGVGQSLDLQYQQTLSGLLDLDYAKALTDLVRVDTELKAAQKSFTMISGLSLFSYL